ncbi:MAG: hypothetical protein ACR652_15375 [Methylocystis sp.]|uniref:hypothetical protein n=1 Tax=Methylocystis sp. TaxID=1911079 RepID=UPI003DA33F86
MRKTPTRLAANMPPKTDVPTARSKSMAATVKADLQEIHYAETKAAARAGISVFQGAAGRSLALAPLAL